MNAFLTVCALLAAVVCASATAATAPTPTSAPATAPPQLYRQPAYESPVNGDPDDLLLLAGYGLAVDDTVVYREVRDSRRLLTVPDHVPARSDPEFGVAPIVSTADVPYALTINCRRRYGLGIRMPSGYTRPTANGARP